LFHKIEEEVLREYDSKTSKETEEKKTKNGGVGRFEYATYGGRKR
jgi:hypothetical protein